ncbi:MULTISPECIES: RagB/SusD family nutrient uptake outer membrane protein [Flavobacteriaceae]|uniref:RagB/SusD family nutrient uptake outer membrane protein n=1 Tax=Flavobacteriaceae TaxID=49546 RepID=UPI0014911A5C|nr:MULTISPECIES: RagB/SusD family nutrient uptake outer membrane protein [Allomuricauda]MDC6367792.1 RagB/SusD family nutrient uptake outer membrane protein [Muricauda sp. AC10]
MKTKILIITIGLMALVGCTRENYLDFQQKGTIIPSTLDDYRLMLDQVETNEKSNGFVGSQYESFFLNDDISFTRDIAISMGFENNSLAAYTFQDAFYLVTQEDTDWSNYYNQIYTSNIILQGLDNVDASENEKNELKAEARLHRAFAYFNLVNLYSVHYNATTADTDLGVPIREGVELEGVDLTRASVKTVYDYIIEDITTSIDYLPNANTIGLRFRPSKAGALSLLAKVYLYQAEYDKALEQADDALELYNTIRDMNTDIDVDDDVFGGLLYPFGSEDDEVIWYKETAGPESNFTIIVENSLITDLYEAEDLRSRSFESMEILIDTDEIEERVDYSFYTRSFGRMIHVGINTPDLLLIKAECEARLGNISEANTTLNNLRSMRYETGTYTNVNITNQNELLTFVKAERRRELLGQPERLFDLKRYNRFDNDNITLEHEYDGVTYTLEPNSLNWAYPIAQKYILLNPEIEQNPRD